MRNGVEWLMNLAIDYINSNALTEDNGFNMSLVEKVIKAIILLNILHIQIQECYDLAYKGKYRIVIMDVSHNILYKAPMNNR